jgi:hypothetical protein
LRAILLRDFQLHYLHFRGTGANHPLENAWFNQALHGFMWKNYSSVASLNSTTWLYPGWMIMLWKPFMS